ncbi:MAG: flagellar hook-length control protein FliK [Phyllobacterium sp.]
MTIATTMPLRTQREALIRDAGKETGNGERREMPQDAETPPDFKMMLHAAAPKPKPSLQEAGSGEETTGFDDAGPGDESDGDVPANASGIQAQPFMVFEQMLGRQNRDDQDKPAAGKAATGKPANMVDETIIRPRADEDAVAVGEDPAEPADGPQGPALPGQRSRDIRNSLPQAPALPKDPSAGQSIASPQTPDAPPMDKPSDQVLRARDEAPVHRADQRAPEPTMLPQPMPGSPPEGARLSTLQPQVVPAPAGSPVIADVQVVSDRGRDAARVLIIQLQPIELGTVTARLQLKPGGMHIRLTAESSAAAEHLARDHELLGKALQRAGIGDDTSTITISIVDRSGPSGTVHTSPQTGGTQDQQAGARSDSQAQSNSGEPSKGRSADQHRFGEVTPDEQGDKTAKTEPENGRSRGLVV